MKKLFSIAVLLGAVSGAVPPVSAVTIYSEDWGNANTSVQVNGGLPLVGWTGIADSQTSQPYLGIYNGSGANDPALGLGLPENVVYFTGLTLSTGTGSIGQTDGAGMFFTTDTSGAGSAGDSSFADINPASFTNLTFNVEVRNGGGDLTNYFAIQEGGSWYVATNNPLPLYNGTYPTFTNWTMVYTNSAAVWNNLTMNSTFVTIGSQASANLSGPITGIGIVELNNTNFAAGGNGFNYSKIVINQGLGDFPSSPPTNSAPAVTPQYVNAGGGVSFLSQFSGTPNLVFDWQTNGVKLNNGGRISGATGNMLTITNVNANDALPVYSVVVTNFFGKATNSGLSLIVNPTPPSLLYAETFPYIGPNGNLPLSGVGWVTAASAATAVAIFQNGPGLGIVFSYSPSATTNFYYTTVTNDTGTSGLPFVAVNPASYPAVTLQANFAPGNGAGTVAGAVTLYWAVQMSAAGGTNWYSSAKPIPPSLVQGTYVTNQLAFNAAATNWNNLTITTTGAILGSQTSGALAGNITGAGLVFVHNDASGSSMNFEDFEIVTNAVSVLPPTIGDAGAPYSQTVASGGGVSFGVTATGQAPFTYGWTLNGVPLKNGGRISGATGPTLTIADVNSNDAGPVVAFVTNSVGSDESDFYVPTTLSVTNAAVGVLYSETFPFVGPAPGNYPISGVGWVEAVPSAPQALYETVGSDGAAFAYLGNPAATAYYATTASDTNQAGLPFPNINLAGYSDLTLNVDVEPGFQATNVTAYLAVQLNGADWYVAATALPVPASGGFSTYSTVFDPTAANWNNLTVTSAGALIGSAAAGNLRGVMTGAGLVFVTVGSGGDFNFDNFVITGTGLGDINIGPPTNGVVNLSWVGNPAVTLQSATSLSAANWQDVPNTFGVYSLPVSTTGTKFFRLSEH